MFNHIILYLVMYVHLVLTRDPVTPAKVSSSPKVLSPGQTREVPGFSNLRNNLIVTKLFNYLFRTQVPNGALCPLVHLVFGKTVGVNAGKKKRSRHRGTKQNSWFLRNCSTMDSLWASTKVLEVQKQIRHLLLDFVDLSEWTHQSSLWPGWMWM